MPIRHELLPFLYAIPASEPGERLAALKQALKEKGVTRRGWRLYLDFGDALIEALGDYIGEEHHSPNLRRIRATQLLALLAACEMDVPPPPELIGTLPEWGFSRLANVPPLLLRAVWKACLVQQYEHPEANLRDYLHRHITPIVSKAVQDGLRALDSNRLKSGWAAIEAAYTQSKPRITLEAAHHTPHREAQWPIFIRRMEYHGYVFIALVNAQELEEEGDVMQHCVAIYADACQERLIRIYRVFERKAGHHVATLAVEEESQGCWGVHDIRGRRNAAVPPPLAEAAEAVAQLHEELYWQNGPLRREIDEIRGQATCRKLRALPPHAEQEREWADLNCCLLD